MRIGVLLLLGMLCACDGAPPLTAEERAGEEREKGGEQ
jgi:hypothetical protein